MSLILKHPFPQSPPVVNPPAPPPPSPPPTTAASKSSPPATQSPSVAPLPAKDPSLRFYTKSAAIYDNPPPKTLVVFAAHAGDYVHESLSVFLTFGYIADPHVQFVIVLNGATLDRPLGEDLPNLRIIERQNHGYDFCAWKEALALYHGQEFDYYVVMNPTLKGPFLPSWYRKTWIEAFISLMKGNVHLAGVTLNCRESSPGPDAATEIYERWPQFHLQSMIFVLDKVSYPIFQQRVQCLDDKQAIVDQMEMGFSRYLAQQGIGFAGMQMPWRNRRASVYADIKVACNTVPDEANRRGHQEGTTVHPLELVLVKDVRIDDYPTIHRFTEWAWRRPRVTQRRVRVVNYGG